ncbi:MAG: phenylacetate--CoA ligase family protein [Planctomycetota bacterium]|jgi:phenylacetate-CoA ligase
MSPAQMAQYARAHTRYYKEAFAHWDGESFESLPLLTKQTAREVSPFDLLAEPMRDKVVYYGETTGSVGSPTPSFFTRKEFHAATLLTYISPYYAMLRSILGANRTCINGLAFGFTVAGMSFGDLMVNIGGLVANTGSRSTLATPARIARAIARLKPAVIAATPGDFLAWMRIVKEDHAGEYEAVLSGLKVLLSTAELCAAGRAKRIAEHFGIVHIDVYACVEGYFSLPCPCGDAHVLSAYHAELIDEQGELIGTEGTGRFVFTNLVKRSTPMVRYLLDDWVSIGPSSCPYGFKTAIVPHGRYELTIPIGSERVGARHVEEELSGHGLFGDYRVELGAEKVQATIETYAGEPGAKTVKAGLEGLFGVPAEIRLVEYGELTDYRAVRESKPILRLVDKRPKSGQTIPTHL